jgi:hypothetical protein
MQTRSSKQIVTLYSSCGYIRILFVPHEVKIIKAGFDLNDYEKGK